MYILFLGTLLQKKNPLPSKKLEVWHCFTCLQISLMSGLIKDSWILIFFHIQSVVGPYFGRSI